MVAQSTLHCAGRSMASPDFRGLTVFISADLGIVLIKSRKANQSDYEAALRVATYLTGPTCPIADKA
jgi:hypothetical protein